VLNGDFVESTLQDWDEIPGLSAIEQYDYPSDSDLDSGDEKEGPLEESSMLVSSPSTGKNTLPTKSSASRSGRVVVIKDIAYKTCVVLLPNPLRTINIKFSQTGGEHSSYTSIHLISLLHLCTHPGTPSI
jgi:hypothetical protein